MRRVAFFVLALFVAVPKDRARRLIWKHGRRLRGPELVTTAEFNEKLGRSKLLTIASAGRDRAHQRRGELVGQDSSIKTLAAGRVFRATARRCTS